MTAAPAAPRQQAAAAAPELTEQERTMLAWVTGLHHIKLGVREHAALHRLVEPLAQVPVDWNAKYAKTARNLILTEVHRRQAPWWEWSEDVWAALATDDSASARSARFQLVAIAHRLGGHHRLHHRVRICHLGKLAEAVFGRGAVQPALQDVRATLLSWKASERTMSVDVTNALLDLLITCGSPHLADITEEGLHAVLADHRSGRSSRRLGLFKIARVLADKRIIARPLSSQAHHRGPRDDTLATVPAPRLEWAQRWRKLAGQEPSTVRVMFSTILIVGRWAAEKHPEALTPDRWTRDIAAEYVADTMQVTIGQWAGHNLNKTRHGQPIGVTGMAGRIDSLRSFFCDLIDWEWIPARFDPRKVISLPLSLRAQLGPNPRIIDAAAWAKLMAAGLRIDEIRRLELDCIRWDEGRDEQTGEAYPICLLRVPQNKTSGPFSKPVDPVVGQLIEAWKLVRPPKPDIEDRKTRRPRQHLFCFRGQLVGPTYLNDKIVPALCRKAGIPESDSRGALTSHRARATIATQLLNAREPLSLADLQQWLGHKHAASTRHYAAILQRTLSAAYRKADYFARNVRTIQVLVDRESILTGAAAGGEQPWKYYDLGDGYCSYDFFAKCPHRLACARCPFYLPKESSSGQLLSIKDGVEQMLEQLDLTDEERQALEGDREALTALAQRLADTPTPAGPTPKQLGTDSTFIPLTALTDSLAEGRRDQIPGTGDG